MKKTIFVTGGAWFIGSNFLSKFVLQFPDIKFVNIDMLTWAWDLWKLSIEVKEASNYFFEQVDIRNYQQLEIIFKKYNPTDIIHFAAESHVDMSIRNPLIFVETNVQGTQNLLELHKFFCTWRFHYISTDEVYGDVIGWKIFSETNRLYPSNPYSASKAAAEMLVMAYGRTFDIDYVITRSSNNYGPHQNFSSLIPLFIKNIINNEKLPLYGDWLQFRDWIFVEDHCEAIWSVFCHAQWGKIYNIWWENIQTNIDTTRLLLTLLNAPSNLIVFVEDRPWHDRGYSLDISKIKSELNWLPKVDFHVWLKKTVDFYKKLLTE